MCGGESVVGRLSWTIGMRTRNKTAHLKIRYTIYRMEILPTTKLVPLKLWGRPGITLLPSAGYERWRYWTQEAISRASLNSKKNRPSRVTKWKRTEGQLMIESVKEAIIVQYCYIISFKSVRPWPWEAGGRGRRTRDDLCEFQFPKVCEFLFPEVWQNPLPRAIFWKVYWDSGGMGTDVSPYIIYILWCILRLR